MTDRSLGSDLWDVDGNEYVDLVNGFGSIFFGHNPEFIRSALKAQLDAGIEIGPQSPIAGEVAQLICDTVGMERAAFCNTGSEAVTAAIRTARTVTGRDKIAMFAGAYHGIFDEVLVRPRVRDGVPAAQPIAPGIPAAMADNVMVLEYGEDSALDGHQGARRRTCRRASRTGAEQAAGSATARFPARVASDHGAIRHGAWCSTRSLRASACIPAECNQCSA